MAFTADSNSKGNSLIAVTDPNGRYSSYAEPPEIDYNHMHSASTSHGTKKYVTESPDGVYDINSPLITVLIPSVLEDKSKNLSNLSEIYTQSNSGDFAPDVNYNILSDSEKEISDTYYIEVTSIISAYNKRPYSARVKMSDNLSDTPNRTMPPIKNVNESKHRSTIIKQV